jgi:hypothetical protein
VSLCTQSFARRTHGVECANAAGHGLVADIIDTSQEEGSLVAPGVSPRLDELKAAYHALPGLLTRVVEAELARIPRALSSSLSQQTWTCVYLPQARAQRACLQSAWRSPGRCLVHATMKPSQWACCTLTRMHNYKDQSSQTFLTSYTMCVQSC